MEGEKQEEKSGLDLTHLDIIPKTTATPPASPTNRFKRPKALPRKIEKKGRFTIIELTQSPHALASDGSNSPLSPLSIASDSPRNLEPNENIDEGNTLESLDPSKVAKASDLTMSPRLSSRRVLRGSRPRFRKIERKGRFTIIEHSSDAIVLSPKRRSVATSSHAQAPSSPHHGIYRRRTSPTRADRRVAAGSTGSKWITAKDTLKNLRQYDADRVKQKSVPGKDVMAVLRAPRDGDDAPIEKKAPEIGQNRKHLASRQTTVNISINQFLTQQKAMELLIQQQQNMQQRLSQYIAHQEQLHLVTPRMDSLLGTRTSMDSNSSSSGATSSGLVTELYERVEALVTENKQFQQQLAKLEAERQVERCELENTQTVATELRNTCMRIERKYNDERARVTQLEHLNRELQQKLDLAQVNSSPSKTQ